jgi:hypothetical protein
MANLCIFDDSECELDDDSEDDKPNLSAYQTANENSNPLVNNKGGIKDEEKLNFLLDLNQKMVAVDVIRKQKSECLSNEGLEFKSKLQFNSAHYGIISTKEPRNREHRLEMSKVSQKSIRDLKTGKRYYS